MRRIEKTDSTTAGRAGEALLTPAGPALRFAFTGDGTQVH